MHAVVAEGARGDRARSRRATSAACAAASIASRARRRSAVPPRASERTTSKRPMRSASGPLRRGRGAVASTTEARPAAGDPSCATRTARTPSARRARCGRRSSRRRARATRTERGRCRRPARSGRRRSRRRDRGRRSRAAPAPRGPRGAASSRCRRPGCDRPWSTPASRGGPRRPRPTSTSTSMRSPSTRPPPRLARKTQAASPWLPGVRSRSGLAANAVAIAVLPPTARRWKASRAIPGPCHRQHARGEFYQQRERSRGARARGAWGPRRPGARAGLLRRAGASLLKLVLTVYGIVFVAELPDKTALAALVLATRHKPMPVFIGSALALAVQSLVAVAAGQLLTLLPPRARFTSSPASSSSSRRS